MIFRPLYTRIAACEGTVRLVFMPLRLSDGEGTLIERLTVRNGTLLSVTDFGCLYRVRIHGIPL